MSRLCASVWKSCSNTVRLETLQSFGMIFLESQQTPATISLISIPVSRPRQPPTRISSSDEEILVGGCLGLETGIEMSEIVAGVCCDSRKIIPKDWSVSNLTVLEHDFQTLAQSRLIAISQLLLQPSPSLPIFDPVNDVLYSLLVLHLRHDSVGPLLPMIKLDGLHSEKEPSVEIEVETQ